MATPTARSGLYALLAAMDVGPGDEVLVTGFTCEAVAEPILLRGALPVYVDIDARSYAMDPDAVAAAITPRTRSVIIQHTFGLPAPMEAIVALARQHGLTVIEDCALALGSRIDGHWLGGSGDAAIWSFELSKTITVGWGGIVQINRDRELASRVRRLRDDAGILGRRTASRRLLQAGLSGLLYRPEVVAFTGYAITCLFRLGVFSRSATSMHGATPPPDYLAGPDDRQWRVLASQLARVETILEASRRTAERYQSVLDHHGCGSVIPQNLSSGVCLIRFPLQVRNRERFTKFFERVGLEVGNWFSQPVSCSGAEPERYGYHRGDCPTAERVAAHVVNLPVHARMSEQDVEVAVSCLDRYLADYPDEREFVSAALDPKPQMSG